MKPAYLVTESTDPKDISIYPAPEGSVVDGKKFFSSPETAAWICGARLPVDTENRDELIAALNDRAKMLQIVEP